jgi:hypothetical protein
MVKRRFNSKSSSNRNPQNTILIICGGKKTEPTYFEYFARQRFKGIFIKVLNSGDTDPKGLVEFAHKQIEKRKLNINKGDSVWCVVDVDQNTKENIEAARHITGPVHLCLSNPCFELWYLLHFEYYNSKLTQKEAKDRLKVYIQNYEKSEDYSEKLIPLTLKAISNARRLNKQHEGKIDLFNVKCNPSTQVFELVEYIQENKK